MNTYGLNGNATFILNGIRLLLWAWKYQQPSSHHLSQMLAVMLDAHEHLRQVISPESTGDLMWDKSGVRYCELCNVGYCICDKPNCVHSLAMLKLLDTFDIIQGNMMTHSLPSINRKTIKLNNRLNKD